MDYPDELAVPLDDLKHSLCTTPRNTYLVQHVVSDLVGRQLRFVVLLEELPHYPWPETRLDPGANVIAFLGGSNDPPPQWRQLDGGSVVTALSKAVRD